jgi:pimeloyl-ACP methyl ester carboxylesterase
METNMQTWPKRLLFSLTVCSGLFACQEPLPDQTEDSGTVRDLQVESTASVPSPFLMAVKLANVPKETLDQKFAALGVKARTGVDIYRLYYRTTDLQNNPVKATGLIIVPMIRLPIFPWISLQHATITGEAQAPSNKPEEGIFEASQGFITIVADQIGFGGTTGTLHPYLFKNAYPKALIEMLRASKTFFEANGLTVGPLFLRGYSEGAYATMALQKAIETQFSSEFQLVASAAVAGPYELEQTAVAALSLPQVNPVNLSFLTLSYVQYLAPEIDLNKIFAINPEDVKNALNGSKTYEEALQVLPSDPAQLFKPEFIADFTLAQPATPEAQTFRRLLGENAHFKDGWIPKTQTRFYHCRDDEAVPVQATDYALAAIQALAPNAPVSKVILDSPDPAKPYRHGSCPLYYSPVSWFGEIVASQPM